MNGAPSLVNSGSDAVILKKLRINILDAMAKKNRTSSFDDGFVAFFRASTLLLCGQILSFVTRNPKDVISG